MSFYDLKAMIHMSIFTLTYTRRRWRRRRRIYSYSMERQEAFHSTLCQKSTRFARTRPSKGPVVRAPSPIVRAPSPRCHLLLMYLSISIYLYIFISIYVFPKVPPSTFCLMHTSISIYLYIFISISMYSYVHTYIHRV